MSSIDTTNLENIANIDFATFEALHWQGQNPASSYYTALKLAAENAGLLHVENYAEYAKSTNNGSTLSGVLRNNFTISVADDYGIDYSAGSTNRLRVQYEMMQVDLAARLNSLNGGGTGELDYFTTLSVHSVALNQIGLPPEASPLYTPLSILGEHDPDRAEFLFQAALPGDGFVDVLQDGLLLGFGASISGNQELSEILQDYGAQAEWLAKSLDAMQELVNTYPGDTSAIDGRLETYEQLAGLAGGAFDALAGWADGFGSLLGGLELPNWISAPRSLFGAAKDTGSPLVLDLDGDGIELTTFSASTTDTFFDIDGDGFAEQSAWVAADDGLLARDINANGTIDDVTELFGSADIDGFAKLALLDSNGDSIIDQYDDAWDSLLVWQDSNGDAVSQSGELAALASLGIVGIDLAGVEASTATISGNPISHTSTFKYSDGSTDAIVDAWFVHDDVNMVQVTDYVLDARALFLPTLRGFGQLPDLHIAMSEDETLLGLVEDFAANWSLPSMTGTADLQSEVETILYRWAGVDGLSSSSRGPNIDARRLEFMEELFGEEWEQNGASEDPFAIAGGQLEDAFSQIYKSLASHLLLQLGWDSLFSGEVEYNLFQGGATGTFAISEGGIDDLISAASQPGVDAEAYWFNVIQFIDVVVGLENLTGIEEGWLDAAIYASDPLLSLSDIVDAYVGDGSAYDDTINGTAGDDTFDAGAGHDVINGGSGSDALSGNIGNDTLHGGHGNDALYGGDGNDVLYGANDNDLLRPGDGGDIVIGGDGNDAYFYTGGADFYGEANVWSSIDKIVLPAEIELSELAFFRVRGTSMEDSLLIEVGSLGSVELGNLFKENGQMWFDKFTTIEFADSSTFDIATDLLSLTAVGTDDYDHFTGATGTYSIDETFYGFGGNDDLRGGSGDDTLDGGSGNDYLAGGIDNDTYVFSAGLDTVFDANGSDDVIVLPEGYTFSDIRFFRHDVYDLRLSVEGLGQMTIDSQLSPSSSANQIEKLFFEEDQSTLLFHNMSVEQRGSDSNDYLSGIDMGASQNDILNGMGGNDTLSGGWGDDSYVFSEGVDTVSDTGATTDTIVFWERWLPQDIDIYRQGVNLVLQDGEGNKTTVLDHFYYIGGREVEFVEFHDQTVWEVAAMNLPLWGTESGESLGLGGTDGDTIYGFGGADYISTSNSGDDFVDGGDGDDDIFTVEGNDTVFAGIGSDFVNSGPGNDVVHGGAGNDLLNGLNGDDTLYGQDGLDSLYGGDGNDAFVFEAASAYNDVDVINDFDATDDVIDITDLLTAYDPMSDLLTDFVQITDDGTDSTLAVDADGGADNFVAVASILNATGLTDEEALASSGALLAA